MDRKTALKMMNEMEIEKFGYIMAAGCAYHVCGIKVTFTKRQNRIDVTTQEDIDKKHHGENIKWNDLQESDRTYLIRSVDFGLNSEKECLEFTRNITCKNDWLE